MQAAFVLHLSVDGSRPPTAGPAPTATDLGFAPGTRHRWTNGPESPNAITLEVHAPEGAPAPWSTDERGGIAAVVGHVRRRARDWSAPAAWPRDVAGLGPRAGRSTLHDELQGTFAALCLAADGDGWIASDPLAFRWLYVAERSGELVIATRAALAAHTTSHPDRSPPTRDARTGAWLTALSQHHGRGTGFEGIRLLEPGTILRLDRGRPRWDTAPSPLTAAPTVTRAASASEVAQAAADLVADVSESLHAARSLPIERRVIELTGGKDSRLVLAIAVHAGIHREFEYETVGPPSLPDVRVASSLASQFGLRHHVRFVGLKPPIPYIELVEGFVERAGGLVNGWDPVTGSATPELRMGGIFGEVIRTSHKVPDPSRADGALDRIYNHGRFDRLTLLRPDVATPLLEELNEELRTRPRPDLDPYLRLHENYLGGRLAAARFGAQEELLGESMRFMPLYSLAALRCGLQLSGPDREDELVFAEVMRSASEVLVRHPFASTADWSAGAIDFLAERPAGPPAPDVADRPTAPAEAPAAMPPATDVRSGRGEKAPSLMQHIVEKGRDDRLALLDLAFDRIGPAFTSIVDPDKVAGALARWDDLKPPDRRQLFGAATAALWLAGPTSSGPSAASH